MDYLPNIISLSRFPLALLFLSDSILCRVGAILLALCSDYLDGFLARKQGCVSRLGTILDPLSDRFFVLFAAGVFFFEERLTWWALIALFARDLFLFFFWGYMRLKNSWENFRCQATLWGKVTTVVQLIILLALTLNMVFPPAVFFALVILGAFTFGELLYRVGERTSS